MSVIYSYFRIVLLAREQPCDYPCASVITRKDFDRVAKTTTPKMVYISWDVIDIFINIGCAK